MDLSSGFSTRPYTVRKGDYLYAVARKRGIAVEQIKALNPSLDVNTEDYLVPGMTILLPAGKLSERDQAILSGIGSGSKTRIYPVRKGETIQAIAANRGIPLDKLTQLNPAMDLNKLKGGEKLLLPGGYYTVREKEMLSTVMPDSALARPGDQRLSVAVPVVLTLGLIVAAVVAWQSEQVQEKFKEMKGEFRTVKKKVKGKALRASVRIQSKLKPKEKRDPPADATDTSSG